VATIICNVAGATDNCYVTAKQANEYFAGDERAQTWQNWSDDDRATFLVGATRVIEGLGGPKAPDWANRPQFAGSPYSMTQALFFPRGTDADAGGLLIIPEAVRIAVCEQAFWRLWRRDHPPVVDRDELRDEGVGFHMEPGIGSEQLGRTGRPTGTAPAAWNAIRPFIRGGGVGARLVF